MEKEDIPNKAHPLPPPPPPIRDRIICNHVNEISHNNQYSDWATERMADRWRYVFKNPWELFKDTNGWTFTRRIPNIQERGLSWKNVRRFLGIVTVCVFSVVILGYKSAGPVRKFIDIQSNYNHFTVKRISWLSELLKRKCNTVMGRRQLSH